MDHFIETVFFEFRKLKSLSDKSMAVLSDQELIARDSEKENSVKIIVQHLAGNLLSRWTDFLSSDGEKPWRMRDSEFEEQQISREELGQKWEQGWKVLLDTINSLTKENLEQNITIRGEKLTVTQALIRQVSHYAYHTGQIVQLAKKLKGDKWESLSIPKGKSVEFSKDGTYLKTKW